MFCSNFRNKHFVKFISENKSNASTEYGGIDWDVKYLWIIVFLPALLIIISAAICLYVCHQHGKRIRQERRCHYIEVSCYSQDLNFKAEHNSTNYHMLVLFFYNC